MEKIVFKGPFSMAIMEDSTDLSTTAIQEVVSFVRDQYDIKLDKIHISMCLKTDLDQNPDHHQQKSEQILTVKQNDNGKHSAHLILKTVLKCE